MDQDKQTAERRPRVVSVTDFGADPTGVADSTAAFQAALALAPVQACVQFEPVDRVAYQKGWDDCKASFLSSAPAQPVREPMTDEQIYDFLYWPADVGGFDEVRDIVRQVERHHGICKE